MVPTALEYNQNHDRWLWMIILLIQCGLGSSCRGTTFGACEVYRLQVPTELEARRATQESLGPSFADWSVRTTQTQHLGNVHTIFKIFSARRWLFVHSTSDPYNTECFGVWNRGERQISSPGSEWDARHSKHLWGQVCHTNCTHELPSAIDQVSKPPDPTLAHCHH